jgi:hydroxypyruvate isomerase
VYQLSANIELLFKEAGEDAGDRVRAAAAAGFDAVEMWFSTDKDLDSLEKALADTGVQGFTSRAPISLRPTRGWTSRSSTPSGWPARGSCWRRAWASPA